MVKPQSTKYIIDYLWLFTVLFLLLFGFIVSGGMR